MIFIDLKKAFYTVDHAILLDKLKFDGISGLEHDWFRSYLNNRKQFCKVNGVSSDIKDIDIGVPQGSSSGPLLFLLYINDLPFALKKAKANMYAGDTTISYSSKNLEEVHNVLNGNKLSLNVVKTQAMIVRLSDFHTREQRNTKNDIAVPLIRMVSGQKAFSYRGTKVWNMFNYNIKEVPSVFPFKSRLRQFRYENL